MPIFLSVTAAFCATLSASLIARKMQRNIGIVCAFAAGFFIAIALFDLLPAILALWPEIQVAFYLPLGAAIAGFLILNAKYHFAPSIHLKNHEIEHHMARKKVGLLSTIEFCANGFLEGLAIGLGLKSILP